MQPPQIGNRRQRAWGYRPSANRHCPSPGWPKSSTTISQRCRTKARSSP